MTSVRPDPGAPTLRFEATVHPRADAVSAAGVEERVSGLDLDRLPDAAGALRVLLRPDDVARLTEQGLEVRVQQALPVRPLDPGLVADDEAVDRWFRAAVRDG